MTCGVTQAIRLGRKRVACVSTGNTSASMAAYASAAGLDPIVFIPHGNISYGKLAQALEYGARTLQVDANFDQILALVRVLAERAGIYLLNSINPFRIEGQKTIIFEMLDQRDWNPPDWIVLPGGNLGNTSAFGKALRELPRVRIHPQDAAAGGDSSRRRRAVLRVHANARRVSQRAGAADAGHRHTNRRSGVVAQGAARGYRVERSGGKSERAGNRRCEGHHRTLRNRLRAGVGRDIGRDSKADRVLSNPAGTRM